MSNEISRSISQLHNHNIITKKDKTEVINGIKWYTYFIEHEEEISVMDDYTENELNLKFCVSINVDKIRKFAIFESCEQFLKYIWPIPMEHWTFFELILKTQKQKIYFDIDVPSEKIKESIEKFGQLVLSDLIQNVLSVLYNTYNITLIPEKDLLVFSSHGPHKQSYHVVIDNYSVDNNLCNDHFYTEVTNSMIDIYKPFVDHLYSSKQQYRLMYSQKYGSSRPKIPVFNYSYGIHNITYSGDMENLFYNSCITNTKTCNRININIVVNSTSTMSVELSTNLNPDLINEVFSRIDPTLFKIFKPTKVINTLILLERQVPAFCTLCNRAHDNENAFLSITPNGQVFFHCRRNDTRKKHVTDLYDFVEETHEISDNTKQQISEYLRSIGETIIPKHEPEPINNEPPTINKLSVHTELRQTVRKFKKK